MSKYSFEEYDSYGVLDWAVQAYNKWLTDRQKCVDIDKLHYYTRSASMTAGTIPTQYNCVIIVYIIYLQILIKIQYIVLRRYR